MFLFILLFTIGEIYLLVQVGEVIGAGEVIWLVLLTAVFGIWFAKSQGAKILSQVQEQLQKGLTPTSQIIHGFLIFIGGVLLVLPGLITDFFGLMLVLPPTRWVWVKVFGRLIPNAIKSGRFSNVNGGGLGGFRVYTYSSSSSSSTSAKSTAAASRYRGGDDFRDVTPDFERLPRPPMKDVTPKKTDKK